MIEVMAQAITNKFIEKSLISKTEKSIYVYGCEILISEVISTCILFVIGLCMGKFVEVVIYLLTFTCVRIYAGGYHAGSYNRCIFIFSTCAYLFLVVTECIIKMDIMGCLIFAMLLADAVIVVLAPVEDRNKKLATSEIIRYKKVTRVIITMLSSCFIMIFLTTPHWRDEISYAMIAICEIAILLIAGVIKNRLLS